MTGPERLADCMADDRNSTLCQTSAKPGADGWVAKCVTVVEASQLKLTRSTTLLETVSPSNKNKKRKEKKSSRFGDARLF